MKKIIPLLIFCILLSSCSKKPSAEETLDYYKMCAKNDVSGVVDFLSKYPDYADIPLFTDSKELREFKKTNQHQNNLVYQKFAEYLISEGIKTFTEEEKGTEDTYIHEYKRFPIHIAAGNGYLDLLKILIEHNSDVNRKAENGCTPLLLAVEMEDIDVIKELLKNNADINLQNDEEVSPLTYSIYFQKDISIVKELLENGAKVEYTTQKYTPLMIASNLENIEVMKLLLEYGANVNTKTTDGQSALELAAIKGSKKSIDFLLENGADVNSQNNQGYTPTMIAVGLENIDLLNKLIKAGADLNAKDKNGVSALMNAILVGNYNIVNKLIKSGADVNASTSITGNYVLDFAVAVYEENKTDKSIMTLLVNNGAKSPNVDISKYITKPKQPSTPKVISPSELKYALTDDGNGVVITKYTGNYPNIIFPNEIEGFPVRQIGQYESVFKGNKTVFEKVSIPDTVVIIKDSAFSSANIKQLVIPDSVRTIRLSAIDNIGYLEKLTLPDRLDQDNLSISFSRTCNINEVVFPRLSGASPKASFYCSKESKIKKVIFPQGAQYIEVSGDVRNIGEFEIPSSIEYFTGRVLLNPTTKFNFPSSVRNVKFSYYWYMVSSGEFAPYMMSNCTLKQQKEIQDFWRNLGYDRYFAEEKIF